MKHLLAVILLTFFGFSPAARAALSLPSNMTDGEQELILQLLGFGTSFRPVDNPYPLGGYSGFEVGLGMESLSTEDIGYFGSTAAVDRNVVYPRITIGKGVYNSIDLFFSFMPYTEMTSIGIYSGGVRWSFFQATFVPATFSLLVHATNTNINNVFISQTEGADLITGVNVDPLSFYVGAGTLYGEGQFDPTLTNTKSRTNQTGRSFHTLIGLNLAINEVFTAFEIDTYNSTTVSLKIGARL